MDDMGFCRRNAGRHCARERLQPRRRQAQRP